MPKTRSTSLRANSNRVTTSATGGSPTMQLLHHAASRIYSSDVDAVMWVG